MSRYFVAVSDGARLAAGGRPNVRGRFRMASPGNSSPEARAPVTARVDRRVRLSFRSGRWLRKWSPRGRRALWMRSCCLELHATSGADESRHHDELRIDLTRCRRVVGSIRQVRRDSRKLPDFGLIAGRRLGVGGVCQVRIERADVRRGGRSALRWPAK